MSVQVSLRGMLRLTKVDTLRRVHIVGFLVERLILEESVLAIFRSVVIYDNDLSAFSE